jgi:hypothetical protein
MSCCCMGRHTFQALFLWHQFHFVYQPPAYQVVDDQRQLTSKLARWALILQEYEFKVIHRPGITHQNADTMSRRPFTTSEDFSEAK